MKTGRANILSSRAASVAACERALIDQRSARFERQHLGRLEHAQPEADVFERRPLANQILEMSGSGRRFGFRLDGHEQRVDMLAYTRSA